MTDASNTDSTTTKPVPKDAPAKVEHADTKPDAKPLQEAPGPAALKSQREIAKQPVDAKTAAQLPELQLTKLVPLSGQEKQIANMIQSNMLLRFAEDYTSGSGGDATKQQALVQSRLKNLESERQKNEWGPESQAALKDYVTWVQQLAIPRTVRDLDSTGVAMPPGYPVKIPTDSSGKVISDADYAKQLSSGGGQIDLKIGTPDAPKVPNLSDLEKLSAASDWTNRARADIKKKEGADWLASDQRSLGKDLPASWAIKPGQDLEQYTAALRVGSNLYNQLSTAAIAVNALNQMGDSKLELPPGITVTNDAHGIPRASIDLPANLADLQNDPKIKQYLEWYEKTDPRITQDASTLKLATKNKYMNLLYADVPLPGSTDINGNRVSNQAILDGSGRLVGIIDPSKEKAPSPPAGADGKPGAPYKTVDVDAIKQRFTAHAVNPNDENSDIVVDISVQAQQSVPIGYDLLNKNIGAPLQLETRTYKADDMVLYNGKLVQAKTLPERLNENQALYVGDKAFNIALDASMFVGGASALAKVALEGSAKAVAEIATKEAAATVTAGAERIVVARSAAEALAGLGGAIGNNAWGHEYAPWIDQTRAVYFGGTGIAGMSSGLQSMMSGGEAVQQAMKAAGPAWLQTMSNVSEKTMNGLMPIMYGQIAVGVSSRYYDLLKSAVQKNDTDPLAVSLLMASELPAHTVFGATGKDSPAGATDGTSLASIAQDYKSQIKSDAPGAKDAQDILDKAGNFDKLSDAEKSEAKKQWTENLTFTADDIKQLDRANNGKLSDQEIQNLMDPQTRATMKESVRQTAEQIWANRNSDKFPEIDNLRALEATPDLDQQTASQLQDQIDQLKQQQKAMNANIQTASRMALLMTAASKDGTLPATMGATTEKVGSHLATEWGYGLGLQIPSLAIIGKRSVTENISSQALLNGLRSDLYSGTMSGTNPEGNHEGTSKTAPGASNEGAKNGQDQLGGANLAVADLLSRTGALAPQQYASIIEDKLANGTAEEKARLLSTAAGPITASVLDGLYQSQIRMQDPTLSDDQKSLAQATNFGNGYNDLMRSLAKAASSDPDEKVRAMAAATYEGGKRLANNLDQNIAANQVLAAYQSEKTQSAQNSTDIDQKITQQQSVVAAAQADRKKIIDRMQSELEIAKTDPSAGMASIKNDLVADLQAPLPKDDAAAAIEKKVNAGITLSLINSPGADGEANRQLINSSISEAFSRSDRAQSLHIMNTLPPELSKQLSTDAGFNAHLLDLLPTAQQAAYTAYTGDTVSLLGKISQFGKGASPELKSELQNKLNDLISARAPISLALPQTQAAAAKAASTLNAQGTLDSLEQLAGDVNGSNPISREAAVQALADMQDPKLKSLLPDLLSKETDQQVHSQLLALNEKLSTGSSATDADMAIGVDAAKRFVDVATIAERYPTIKNFGDDAQTKFLKDNNLELLSHDTFEYQAKVAARKNIGAMVSYGLQEELPKLVKQREAEFSNLIKLSQGDSTDSTTQMARLYLERIAGSQGKPLTTDDSTFAIPMELGLGGTITANYNERTGQIGSMVVNNPRTPDITNETTHIPINKPRAQTWQDEAAAVLAQQAATKKDGVDLNGYLIGNLLSNPTGLSDGSVNSLADSWRAMYAPDGSGRRIISPDRYKYAITRAIQTEQLKRQAQGANITSAEKNSLDALDAKLQGMLSDLG